MSQQKFSLLIVSLMSVSLLTACSGSQATPQVQTVLEEDVQMSGGAGVVSTAPGVSPSALVTYVSTEPIVVSTAVQEPVQLQIQTDGSPDSIVLQLADGSTISLTPSGQGLYSATLPHDQVLYDYQADDVNHNFVGYIDIYRGGVRQMRGNLFVEVSDNQIPNVAVKALTPDMQASPHLVNLFMPGADPSTLDLQAVTQRFYGKFEDVYDFINIISTPWYFGNRYHFAVRNDVQGIGLSVFDSSASYGSNGKLLGITRYPIPGFFDLAETSSLHELGHQWINHLDVPALQGVKPHWPISSLAPGIMGWNIPGSGGVGGQFPWELVPIGNGDYQLNYVGLQRYFSDMELYLMGMLAPESVGSHFVFTNQNQQVCTGCVLKGPTVPFTTQDIINVHGRRVPAYPNAQTHFRVASIIVSKFRLLTNREMAFFDYFANRGEATAPLLYSSGFSKGTTWPFAVATNDKGSLATALSPHCGITSYDFDLNGQVDAGDIQVLVGRWHQTAGPPYDFDGNSKITIVDIMREATNWGRQCP